MATGAQVYGLETGTLAGEAGEEGEAMFLVEKLLLLIVIHYY